eukprot:5257828-Pyramimonas_sp.AAC.1
MGAVQGRPQPGPLGQGRVVESWLGAVHSVSFSRKCGNGCKRKSLANQPLVELRLERQGGP